MKKLILFLLTPIAAILAYIAYRVIGDLETTGPKEYFVFNNMEIKSKVYKSKEDGNYKLCFSHKDSNDWGTPINITKAQFNAYRALNK